MPRPWPTSPPWCTMSTMGCPAELLRGFVILVLVLVAGMAGAFHSPQFLSHVKVLPIALRAAAHVHVHVPMCDTQAEL